MNSETMQSSELPTEVVEILQEHNIKLVPSSSNVKPEESVSVHCDSQAGGKITVNKNSGDIIEETVKNPELEPLVRYIRECLERSGSAYDLDDESGLKALYDASDAKRLSA